MKIKKLGHCCFVAEPRVGVRIMTDPGHPDFCGDYLNELNLSAVLITHEHADHLHVESLKKVLESNPNAIVITNVSVGKILDNEGVPYVLVEQRQKYDLNGVTITGFGDLHAEIYLLFGRVQNTGYTIDNLCFPGDAFHYPDVEVDILALPVAGPWMVMKDAIEYAKKMKPRVVFPVHDGMIKNFATFIWKIPEALLTPNDIVFKKLEIGVEEDI